MRIYRLHQGQKWPPHLNSEGKYVLADPRFGAERHHSKNQVLADTEEEAISMVRRGFSLRMKSSTSPSLVRTGLFIDDVKFT
jgi:hypothetical protein